MAISKPLNFDELHLLGIKVVYKHLIDNGYNVLATRNNINENPQIFATLNNQRYAIVVRTARYPKMGVLQPKTAAEVLLQMQKNNALCLFASVGIANADGDNETEMAEPNKDGHYIINFKGLQNFPSF